MSKLKVFQICSVNNKPAYSIRISGTPSLNTNPYNSAMFMWCSSLRILTSYRKMLSCLNICKIIHICDYIFVYIRYERRPIPDKNNLLCKKNLSLKYNSIFALILYFISFKIYIFLSSVQQKNSFCNNIHSSTEFLNQVSLIYESYLL